MLGYTDTSQLGAVRSEVIIWSALQTAVREPKAIVCTASSGGNYNVRIALKQRVPGEAQNAIAAAFGCLANVKNVFVVDPDIDITSDAQMDWALATRFQADRDLTVVNGMRALPLDPSLNPGTRIGAKAGFDCTVPFGRTGVDSLIPEIPTYGQQRFPSIRAALEHGPKRYEELMAAVDSRDGREIVLELEALRAEFTIGRDALGRYTLAKRA
jgi:3-polyprenyl-4-hydroxybenzoate decarboxylase